MQTHNVNETFVVLDLEKKDVNFELIKIVCKVGGRMEDSQLVRGVVIDKSMSHPQMPKVLRVSYVEYMRAAFYQKVALLEHRIVIAMSTLK